MGGDVDAAIEYLIAEQGAEESSGETNSTSIQLEAAYGNDWLVFVSFFYLTSKFMLGNRNMKVFNFRNYLLLSGPFIYFV